MQNLPIEDFALRVKDIHKAAEFYIKVLGYKIQSEFILEFGDAKIAQCISLENKNGHWIPQPEVFISDGTSGSIVDDWVNAHGGVGGIHHIAYLTHNVLETMKLWQEQGIKFSSEKPLTCKDGSLTQIFTVENPFTGLVYELIERTGYGFCSENVLALMKSSK